jgi:prolyl-tRNA synthetase
MRAREFVMKDAYSFHTNEDSLMQTYQLMYETYSRIFTRIGLQFRAVSADTGAIGGSGSHEFHVLADSGEDAIAFCPDSDYAANIELASSPTPPQSRSIPDGNMQKIATPGKKTCAEVAEFLKIPLNKTLKTLAVKTNDQIFFLLLRGDHQLNELKVRKIPFLSEFQLANEEDILDETGTVPGYIGPVGLNTCVIADQAVINMSNFVCGANEEGFHLMHVNFDRDLKLPEYVFDIRNVVPGDASPDGKGILEICRGIEVGHIFQLRTKYSKIMKATFLDESGCTQYMEMGCYGIGVSRIVAAAIEQNHDEYGIIFPDAIAPFQLAIIPIGLQKNPQVKEIVEKLYQQFLDARIEVLLDDRDERPGVMFADMELMGIPHRIVIGERGLKQSTIEYQGRKDRSPEAIFIDEIFPFIFTKLCID